jgi:hypothetical protein
MSNESSLKRGKSRQSSFLITRSKFKLINTQEKIAFVFNRTEFHHYTFAEIARTASPKGITYRKASTAIFAHIVGTILKPLL